VEKFTVGRNVNLTCITALRKQFSFRQRKLQSCLVDIILYALPLSVTVQSLADILLYTHLIIVFTTRYSTGNVIMFRY
jgi:hypothetical protein